MPNDKAAAALLPDDPDAIVEMVRECLKNPQGEIALIMFSQRERGYISNIQIQGGENLIAVLLMQAIEMGNFTQVEYFISRMRIILDEAERGIDNIMRHRSVNN